MKLLLINSFVLTIAASSGISHAYDYDEPSVSARQLRGSSRSVVSSYASIKSSDWCIPNDRPRPHAPNSPHPNGNRNRFRLVQRDAICVGSNGRGYEYGGFANVRDSDQCADMCINDAGWDLQPELRGFNFMCDTQECQCLYDEGTLNNRSAGAFDFSNHQNRDRKGSGAINTRVARQSDANCFSLTSNSNMFFDDFSAIVQSDENQVSSTSSSSIVVEDPDVNQKLYDGEDDVE